MKKEQSIRKIGKLMLAISSCGVLLTAFQADKSVFAEDATTTEATTAAAATTEATTESTTATTATTEATTEATTAAPTRAAKEVNAKVTGTIKNHDIKYYEYYTDVDIAVSLTDDDVKEGDYVTITLENVAVLGSLDGKDVIYEGKKIGTIKIVSFENINKARQGSNNKAQMEQAELESTRATLKITFTKAVEAVKPDVLKQAQFTIKSDNAYNGAVIANKDYTLNQVIKVGDSSVTSTVDIPKVEKFATETNSIHMPPSGNTIKFNEDGSYETSSEIQVRGREGMKVGSTVELEFNDASGIEWKTSGDTALKVGDTFKSSFILPVYSSYDVNQYGAYVFPTGVEPTFKVTSITDKKITLEMISGDVPKELGVFFRIGKDRVTIIDKSKIDIEKMQYDVSTVATATIDGKDSKGIYIYRIISDSTSAQLVLDSLVTDYKDIDTQESIKATDRGWKDPATIDGYEFVSTEKDREGNRIHWYRKISQPTTTEETTEETTEVTTTTTTTTEETTEVTTTTTTTEQTTEETTEVTTTTTTTEETTEETTEVTITTTTPEEPKQNELPNTGVATTAITTGLATLFAGLGLAVSKKKK